MQSYILKRKQKKYGCNIDLYDPYEFIWGVKSSDDMSNSKVANFYTMNDFEIVYNKDTERYRMSVETIYHFPTGIEAKKNYLNGVLNRFAQWMEDESLNTSHELEIWDIFTEGKGINYEYETIEELYAVFKSLVKGFGN